MKTHIFVLLGIALAGLNQPGSAQSTAIISNPTASQTVTQPSGTSLSVQGNVGIGTSDPAQNLEVGTDDPTSTTVADGMIRTAATNGSGLTRSWDFGVSHTYSPFNFTIRDTQMSVPALTLQFGTGNVGIGTFNPGAKLDVTGNVNILGTVTVNGQLIPFGSNTNGQNNVSFGDGALGSNTSGTYNSAFGASTLSSNTTGRFNTAVGVDSLINATSDLNNAFGYQALSNITTGYGNTGIGWAAGSYYPGPNGDVPNQTSTESIYIGFGTHAKTDGDTNEIVIGNKAYGNGSNTVTLGNGAIATTVLQGNVGIGTTAPAAKLEVNGGAQIDGRLTFFSMGSGITFADGSTLTSASYVGSGSGGGTSSGGALPSDLVYTDTQQVINASKSFTGGVEIGGGVPTSPLEIDGSSDQQTTALADGGSRLSHLAINALDTTLGAGGAITFGNSQSNQAGSLGWAAIKGSLVNGNGNTTGDLAFSTRNSITDSTLTERVRIAGSGNVGIGTSNPGQGLQLIQNSSGALAAYTPPGAILQVSGTIALTTGSGGAVLYADGTLQSTAWNGTTLGGDYAESVDVMGDRSAYEPGDVIVINGSVTGKFDRSNEPYSKMVAGVYSTKPGLVGRRTTSDRPDREAEVPMAMVGIVPTKVTTENGPVERGDLLVSSSTPGYAMKGTDRDRLTGTVIGKALAPMKSGSGIIEVLLALQ